jgi:hypothetical protein
VTLPAPILDQVVEHLINREKGKPKGHYPSSAYKCTRQQWYSWKEVPTSNPISAAGALRMFFGKAKHEGFTNILKEMQMDMIDEVNDTKHFDGLKYPIRYRVDHLRKDANIGIAGGEVKSTFGRGVVQIQETGKPRDHDIPQIVTYAKCSEIYGWNLIYFGTDTAYYTEFLCAYDPEDDAFHAVQQKNGETYTHHIYPGFAEVYDRFKAVEIAIKLDNPPARPYQLCIKNGEAKTKFQHNRMEYKSHWFCSYCDWRDHCWAEYLAKDGIWYGEERIG